MQKLLQTRWLWKIIESKTKVNSLYSIGGSVPDLLNRLQEDYKTRISTYRFCKFETLL